MPTYVLGIDAGTESIRAAVYDENGTCHGFGTSNNETIHEQPGFAEQRVPQWEHSLIDAVRSALQQSGIHSKDVCGMSVDGTSCTVVFLDKNKKSIRNSIIWMDVRAIKEAERIAATKDPSLKYVGFGNVSPEWFPCKLLWIKENEPEIFKKTYNFLWPGGFVIQKLTGRFTMEWSRASWT